MPSFFLCKKRIQKGADGQLNRLPLCILSAAWKRVCRACLGGLFSFPLPLQESFRTAFAPAFLSSLLKFFVPFYSARQRRIVKNCPAAFQQCGSWQRDICFLKMWVMTGQGFEKAKQISAWSKAEINGKRQRIQPMDSVNRGPFRQRSIFIKGEALDNLKWHC